MLGFGDFMFGRTAWQAPTATWLGGTGSYGNSNSLSSLSIGGLNAGSEDRIVIVGVVSEATSDVPTVTVGGFSGVAVGVSTTFYCLITYYAFYNIAATTVNVAATFTQTTNHSIGVWKVIFAGGSSAVYTGRQASFNNTNGPISATITTYTNGVILGMATKPQSSTTPSTWSGTNAPVTDATVSNGRGSNRYGHLNATTGASSTISVTGSDSNKALSENLLAISPIPFY